ncbi:MAG: methionine--tRNA ligase [Verrucomicrobiota bacterium]|nr:methionine--tRNA ligase [Verrucomicrobiota bacterium]
MPKKIYLTTAIDYVNGMPHLGHAYEKVLADVIARYHRGIGADVHFLTGVDEHGQKVQQSAQKQNIDPQLFCDQMTANFKNLCAQLNLTNNDFARTTDPKHKKVVQDILQKLFDQGHIYKGKHEGWYSTRAEQFLTEKEMVDGKFPEIYGEVVQLSEENYYFKLSHHQQWLIDYIEKNPGFIYPEFRSKEVLGFLQNPLGDLCISRPTNRLSWGIPIPFDTDYVTFVWFDALINYISYAGYGTDTFNDLWPADYHIIGKDILIPAHAIYWPIMLKVLGIELPKRLIVHGWWLLNKEKMSKSTGNFVDPLEYISKYGADAFRYYVMREMTIGYDSEFTEDGFVSKYNSDLANDLGNLMNRSLSMLKKYRGGIVPAATHLDDTDKDVEQTALKVINDYHESFKTLALQQGLTCIWLLIQRANKYVEESAPWALAKDPEKATKLDTVLYHLYEVVRLTGVLLSPVMPETSKNIFAQLNLDPDTIGLKDHSKWGLLKPGHSMGEAKPLFPRLLIAPPVDKA